MQYLQFTSGIWKYESEPSEKKRYCTALEGKRCRWPRGKVVGGTSAINYMTVTRGTPQDYDDWQVEGWSYEEVLPYFKKIENFQIFGEFVNQSDHGHDGPVTVSYANSISKISKEVLKAATHYGFDYVDYNGETRVKIKFYKFIRYLTFFLLDWRVKDPSKHQGRHSRQFEPLVFAPHSRQKKFPFEEALNGYENSDQP